MVDYYLRLFAKDGHAALEGLETYLAHLVCREALIEKKIDAISILSIGGRRLKSSYYDMLENIHEQKIYANGVVKAFRVAIYGEKGYE